MKISVALCTYNGEKYLANQLESIFNQTWPVDEVVICDDCSTDNTLEIINQYKTKYAEIIHLFANETNLGGKKNFEKALSLTTGDLIFFCDQDDTWELNKVEAMSKPLIENPDCLGAFSDAFLVNDQGLRLNYSFLDSLTLTSEERKDLKPAEICEYILNFGNIVAGCMLVIKKECKELVLPFKLMDAMWHDEWIALILSSRNKLMFINNKLTNYRQHDHQQLGAGSENYKRMVLSYKMLKYKENQLKEYLLYFNHSWEVYYKVMAYVEEIPLLEPFISAYKQRASHAKCNLLLHENYFIRKAKLFKWLLNNEFETSVKEVIL